MQEGFCVRDIGMKVLLCAQCAAMHVKLFNVKIMDKRIHRVGNKQAFSFKKLINTMSFLLAHCVDDSINFFSGRTYHSDMFHVGAILLS